MVQLSSLFLDSFDLVSRKLIFRDVLMFKESLKKLARVKGVRLGYDREKKRNESGNTMGNVESM